MEFVGLAGEIELVGFVVVGLAVFVMVVSCLFHWYHLRLAVLVVFVALVEFVFLVFILKLVPFVIFVAFVAFVMRECLLALGFHFRTILHFVNL